VIAVGVFLALLALAGMFGAGMLAGYQRGLKAHRCVPQVFVAPAPASVQLELSEARVKVRDDLIAVLTSVEVVPVSPWLALPWQSVPSPARTFWVQGIIDEVQDLRDEVVSLTAQLADSRRLHRRALDIIKTLRRRLRASVPVESLAVVEDLRTRSLSVAKSASTRAAEMSNAISELEVLRFEATTIDEFNAECDLIFDRHCLPVVEFPQRKAVAA
jgi:hypothetical protein